MAKQRQGAGRGTGKGYKNLRGFPRDSSIHSDSSKGRKQPQRIGSFHASSHPSPPNDDIAKRHSECARGIKTKQNPYYDYQNQNQEKVIHSGWDKGNSYRFVLEGTGDIFRELTKPERYTHQSYIFEKTKRIKQHIKEEQSWVHPEDSFTTSLLENQDKFALMINQWEVQPYNTKKQKVAIDLNIAMLKGEFTKAKQLVKKIES